MANPFAEVALHFDITRHLMDVPEDFPKRIAESLHPVCGPLYVEASEAETLDLMLAIEALLGGFREKSGAECHKIETTFWRLELHMKNADCG